MVEEDIFLISRNAAELIFSQQVRYECEMIDKFFLYQHEVLPCLQSNEQEGVAQ